MGVKTSLVAVAAKSQDGGIAAYTRSLIKSLHSLAGADVVSIKRIILLKDAQKDWPRQADDMEGRTLFGGGSKAKFVTGVVRDAFGGRPSMVIINHIQLLLLAPIYWLAAPSGRRCLVIYGVDVWPEWNTLSPLYRILFRLLITDVVAISRPTIERAQSQLNFSRKRVHLVPPAVAVDTSIKGTGESGPFREDRQEADGFLLSVTRLARTEKEKGVHRVIQALSYLKDKGDRYQYKVAGEGKLMLELEQLASQESVASQVEFMGYVSDERLDELYREAIGFVLPSTKEGFGIVFLEAWGYQLPVIAANVGGPRDFVRDGWNGLLVPPDDTKELAEAIKVVADRPDVRRRLGLRGWQSLLNCYTQSDFNDTVKKVIEVR